MLQNSRFTPCLRALAAYGLNNESTHYHRLF